MRKGAETKEQVARDVGLRIAELREEAGMTVAACAAKLNVTDRYVQHVEAGRANLTIDSLVKFAKVLRVRVADLFVPPVKQERAPGRPRGRQDSREWRNRARQSR